MTHRRQLEIVSRKNLPTGRYFRVVEPEKARAMDGGSGRACAGATLAAVQRTASDAGWMYGVDLAARDSATIGGTVATNAGGIHVIAHGMTRAQVVGIEAVLPDGSVIAHLSGLMKDNTGHDLAEIGRAHV